MTVAADGVVAGGPAARVSGRGPARAAAVEQLSCADRVARGKDARAVAPLESHAEFAPDGPRDRVGLLLGQATMIPPGMKIYAGLCGWTLARAHARSGDRVALAACLGGSGAFDQAIGDFAESLRRSERGDWRSLVMETVLTAILVSVILNTATGGRSIGHNAAIAVGSTVALLGLFASPISGASMNPARTLGPGHRRQRLHRLVGVYRRPGDRRRHRRHDHRSRPGTARQGGARRRPGRRPAGYRRPRRGWSLIRPATSGWARCRATSCSSRA